jgi:hypothetical protein
MIPHEILKKYIMNGVRFLYESYDHKKALEEMKQINSTANGFQRYVLGDIPLEIKKNHIVWRTGKLWELHFNKNGEMSVFKIGRFPPYVKTFYLDDFGIKVKLMIFKSDDKHDLIGQGLAVEETL